jgi:hypothetical protein
MNPVITIDAVTAIELAEVCDLIDQWLAVDGTARAAYARHIGAGDAPAELRATLAQLAQALTTAPMTTGTTGP